MSALAGSLLFLVVAPGSVAGIGPWLLTHWQLQPGWLALRVVGSALIGVGLIPLVESFVRFALKGLGTPAPIAPPRRLVVSGYYRHVRNPMYVGVVAVVLGQAALFADIRLVFYAAIIWTAMHLFVVVFEEPKLSRSFGAEYERFRAHVPRWLPRLTPWRD